MIGGIDLGGTKIEARVFNTALAEVTRHRIPTPKGSYDDLLEALTAQIGWIEAQGRIDAIGLGTPGLINPETGEMLTANLPASGRDLSRDIAIRAGRSIAVINDCRAFTLSEAMLGAGAGYRNVIGLVLGTGVAGGQAIDGQILSDLNGQHGEFGHLPLPAQFIKHYDLPLLPCGCGLTACYETYLSGPGLVRLAEHMTGHIGSTQDILANQPEVKAAWLQLAAMLIATIARTTDPNAIILGGGLGTLPGLPDDLGSVLPEWLLDRTAPPALLSARHGDASGALGAAIFAQPRKKGVH